MAKNLANCTPKEFMVQTRLIKKSVENWLTETDIMNIRKNVPELPEGIDDEEKKAKLKEQSAKNLSAMFDAIFDEHPDETVELLALVCFVPVSEIDNYPMTYYMESITELLNDKAVWDFFISLAVAAQRLGITQA